MSSYIKFLKNHFIETRFDYQLIIDEFSQRDVVIEQDQLEPIPLQIPTATIINCLKAGQKLQKTPEIDIRVWPNHGKQNLLIKLVADGKGESFDKISKVLFPIHCEVSFLDRNGVQQLKKGTDCILTKTHYEATLLNLHRDYILNNRALLLPDDRLTINFEFRCNLEVLTEIRPRLKSETDSARDSARNLPSPQPVVAASGSSTVNQLLVHDLARFWSNDSGQRKFADVTLICQEEGGGGGAEIQAHRLILAARSPVLASMLNPNQTEPEERIPIPDVKPEILEVFLTFLYTGQVAPQARMEDYAYEELLKLSDKYQVDSLKELCEDCLCTRLSALTVIPWKDLGEKCHARRLEEKASEYFRKHPREVLESLGGNGDDILDLLRRSFAQQSQQAQPQPQQQPSSSSLEHLDKRLKTEK